MAVLSDRLTSDRPVASGPHPAHPLRRATAWSTVIGLLAGLVLGILTQAREHDRG
jgi:hypothetical protein